MATTAAKPTSHQVSVRVQGPGSQARALTPDASRPKAKVRNLIDFNMGVGWVRLWGEGC